MANAEPFTPDVIFDVFNGQHFDIGLITLNRAQALNALTVPTIRALTQQLHQWQTAQNISAVIIQSSSKKAFCAGGDIKQLYQHRQQSGSAIELNQFFREEYQLNYLIHRYPKPFIALLDGITMGGGVGISLHGAYPIATENFTFAMPETSIGFFPDIGSSYLLSRCPGELGTYLALTGAKLNADDTVYAGLIHFCIRSSHLEELVEIIKGNNWANKDFTSSLHSLLQSMQTQFSPAPLTEVRPMIDQYFTGNDLGFIMQSLAQANHPWCNQILETLQTRSPTSLIITLEQIRRAKSLTIEQCFQMDFRLVNRFLQGHDFFEGVRARIVDKDNQPQWQPAHWQDLSEKKQLIDHYFAPLSSNKDLTNKELDLGSQSSL